MQFDNRTDVGETLAAKLSPRQRQVRDLMAAGKNNREIASLLGITVSAVKNTNVAMFDKIGASDRYELVAMTSTD